MVEDLNLRLWSQSPHSRLRSVTTKVPRLVSPAFTVFHKVALKVIFKVRQAHVTHGQPGWKALPKDSCKRKPTCFLENRGRHRRNSLTPYVKWGILKACDFQLKKWQLDTRALSAPSRTARSSLSGAASKGKVHQILEASQPLGQPQQPAQTRGSWGQAIRLSA